MAAFWLSVAGTIGVWWHADPAAGAFMAPTLAWVSIAAKLNSDIVSLNAGDAGKKEG